MDTSRMNETPSTGGLFHHAIRAVLFGHSKKAERPAYDPQIPLEENIRLQLEWVTGARVTLQTHGRDAFIFELRKPAGRIVRLPSRGIPTPKS